MLFFLGTHFSETWFSFNLIPTEFIRWSHAAPILQNPSLPNQSARAQEADQSPFFHPYLNDGLCWSSGTASCSSLIKWWLRKLQIWRWSRLSMSKNHRNIVMEKTMKLGRHGWTWDMGLFDKKYFIIWCRPHEKDEHLNRAASQNPTKLLGKKLLESSSSSAFAYSKSIKVNSKHWSSMDVILLMQVTSVPFLFGLPGSVLLVGQFSFTPLPFGSSCFGSNLSATFPPMPICTHAAQEAGHHSPWST